MSDQPVAPSSGRKPWLAGLAATACFALQAKYWYCQVVPIWLSPLVNAGICFAASAQYSPTFARCSFSRSTAASNCSSSSS